MHTHDGFLNRISDPLGVGEEKAPLVALRAADFSVSARKLWLVSLVRRLHVWRGGAPSGVEEVMILNVRFFWVYVIESLIIPGEC